ncbi:MAG: radical SAM/SPASM domain-containing protein [bacterium]
MTTLPILEAVKESPSPSAEQPNAGSPWNFGFGKEVSFRQLLRALTLKRIWNVAQASISFLFSAITKRHKVWGVPPVLTIEPTNICNLRCPLCVTGNGSMERPYGRMDFETYKSLIDEIGERVLYLVFFNQGEPYLHRQFNDFVAFAKQRGIYVTTSTNAHYFDAENAEAVVRSGIDTLIVSVDGATQETYAHYRAGGSLEKVKDGIRNLAAAKKRLRRKTPFIYMQFLVMRHNEHEIQAMARLARELEVDRLLKKNIQVETFEEAQEWLPRGERYRRYHLRENDFVVKRGGRGVCMRPWLTTMVNWDGTVVPCCFDKNGHHTTGALHDTSFTTIWNAKTYSQFRQNMLTRRETIDICKNCNQGIGLFI